MSIKDKALRWWAREIQHNNHVISSDKNPEQRQRDFLKNRGLIFKVARGSWILKRAEDEISDVFPLLYWQTIVQFWLHTSGRCEVYRLF